MYMTIPCVVGILVTTVFLNPFPVSFPPQRLQEQVNDVIDLHQNAVGELRGQLSQVESMTVTKTQDLEDVMDEYQSKVGVSSGCGFICIYTSLCFE